MHENEIKKILGTLDKLNFLCGEIQINVTNTSKLDLLIQHCNDIANKISAIDFQNELTTAKRQLEEARHEVQDLRSSLSWRITSPLRRTKSLIDLGLAGISARLGTSANPIPGDQTPKSWKDSGKSIPPQGGILIMARYFSAMEQQAFFSYLAEYALFFTEAGYLVTLVETGVVRHEERMVALKNAMDMRLVQTVSEQDVLDLLRQDGEQFDLVLFSGIPGAAHYLTAVRSCCSGARIVLDAADMDWFLNAQDVSGGLFAPDQEPFQPAIEPNIAALFQGMDAIIVHHEFEKTALEAIPGLPAMVVIHPVQALRFGAASFDARGDVVFFGDFSRPGDLESATFLARHVWPLVRQALPDRILYLVGANLTEEVRALADMNLVVVDADEARDPSMLYRSCRVCIALEGPRGKRDSILRALAHGLPCATNVTALIGTCLGQGREVMSADNAGQIAEATIRLYEDQGLWQSLSRDGLAYIRRHHAPRVAQAAIRDIVQNLALPDTLPQLISFPPCESPRLTLIVITPDAQANPLPCLSALHRQEDIPPYEVFFVTNPDSDPLSRIRGAVSNINLHLLAPDQTLVQSLAQAFNAVAAQAQGEHLIFLSSTTIPCKDALKNLLGVFSSHPGAGMVGPKIVGLNGRLLAAGGFVDLDGNTWLHGEDGLPEAPEFNYLRPVDFCPGECFAIPRELFDAAGECAAQADDLHEFAQALACQVVTRGRAILYQPRAVVLQTRSPAPFARPTEPSLPSARAPGSLALAHPGRFSGNTSQGFSADLGADNFFHKKILVLESHMISPDKDAGSLRMFNLLQEMVGMKLKVDFATMLLADAEPYRGMLQDIGVQVLYRPFVPSVEAHLRTHGGEYDYILISRLDTARTLLHLARRHAPAARLIYDTVDLHYLRSERMAALYRRQDLMLQAENIKAHELQIIESADLTLVVSPVEKEILSAERPDARVEVLPTILDTCDNVANFDDRRHILFIGGFLHTPNIDAVDFFVADVFPLILREIPDMKFYIVGSHPPEEVRQLQSPSVIVTGFVDDPGKYFGGIRLSVAPLRYGAGVKGKINMSMAYGVPVVATPLAVEGMHLTHEHDALVGDSASTLAQCVVRAYQDRDLWQRLSANGRSNVEQHFSRHVAGTTLRRLLEMA